MTKWSKDAWELALAILLAGSSAVSLATCARSSAPAAMASEGARAHGDSEQSPVAADDEHEPAAGDEAAAPSSGSETAHPLDAFRGRLAKSSERADEPVRILWLGDSHTAADFMTDALRGELTKRAGVVGPGFVRVGMRHYRHARARFEVGGKWGRAPQQPSRRSTVLDGVFGLCGIRTVPEAGATASVRVSGMEAKTPVRWTLSFRLPGSSALQVRLGERSQRLRAVEGQLQAEGIEWGALERVEGSTIHRWVIEGTAEDELKVAHVAGTPEVFGAFVEKKGSGVVLDTCGIDGARIATVLAWDAEAWQAEVRARKPDLVVLAYGTNEAFDGGSVQRYADEYRKVMGRLRGAVPDLPCWIVGPPDAWDRSGRAASRVVEITEVQRKVAEELGCGFSSTRELMGGDGSFTAWRNATPQLARADGVHLSREGYEKLGVGLAQVLLSP